MYDQIELDVKINQQISDGKQRHLAFTSAKNFRDLGGYRTLDGRTVRWGKLYRSDQLNKLTDADLVRLTALNLNRIIDFRAEHEKEMEPDRLPTNTKIPVVEIPILDSTTQIWHESGDQYLKESFKSIEPVKFLIQTHVELTTRFTPQIKQFINEIIAANGRPVLFHCAAGKDRTGYAAALLLRILGASKEVALEDYLLSNNYYLPSYSWNLFILKVFKGKRYSEVLKGFLEAHPAYLSAAFENLDREFGSFENYVENGLQLTAQEIDLLRDLYLE